MDKFEEEVKQIIKNYGAGEQLTQDLMDFLIESGNAVSIGESYREHNS